LPKAGEYRPSKLCSQISKNKDGGKKTHGGKQIKRSKKKERKVTELDSVTSACQG